MTKELLLETFPGTFRIPVACSPRNTLRTVVIQPGKNHFLGEIVHQACVLLLCVLVAVHGSELALSFSGCGFLGTYHFGVLSCLSRKGKVSIFTSFFGRK